MKAKKIIIVGAGHGGLVAGSILARNGYDVQIYEKEKRQGLGWDWYDHVHKEIFEDVGIQLSPDEYNIAANHTYWPPDLKSKMALNLPLKYHEIGIERKLLYVKLFELVEQSGALLTFETKVDGPYIENGVIKGVNINGAPVKADFVIDAAGLHSPIRKNMPDSYHLTKDLNRGEIFYGYRAFYSIVEDLRPKEEVFDSYFGFNDIRGIAWFQYAKGEDSVDIFFGKIDPFKPGEIEELMAKMREIRPAVGTKIIRGGQQAQIPVRRTLDTITGPNYAAVGDSACMTVPLNGCGVESTLFGGKVLAQTIINAHKTQETEQTRNENSEIFLDSKELWPFYYEYFQNYGAKFIGTDLMKSFMMTIPWSQLSFVFKQRLITVGDFEATRRGEDINIPFIDLLGRILRGVANLPALFEIKNIAEKSKNVSKTALKIPKEYDPEKIARFQAKMNSYFKSYEEILINHREKN